MSAAVAAVREESKIALDLESDEYLDEEMKLVPARISKAIRRTMRLSKEATAKAEAKKQNMTAEKEAAEKKAAEAGQRSDDSDAAAKAAATKRKSAEEKMKAASKAMESNNEAQTAWKAATAKLEEMETKYKDQEDQYEKLSEKVKKEIAALLNEKLKAAKALQAAEEEKMKQSNVAEKLKAEATAKGGIATDAMEKAEQAQEEVLEAEKNAAKLKTAAEEAQAEYLEANAKAERSEQLFLDAKSDLDRKTEVAALIKDVREGVQGFYDAMDKSSKSMEKIYDESEGKADAKPAHEVMRTNPDVKAALVAYNEMVLTFRRLHVTSKDFYTYVADSLPEIHDNAEAAIQLQCDPTEELERKAKETKNMDEWRQKCGSAVWKDLKLEQQRFPHLANKQVNPETVVKET